jgi:hypothetical protein
MKNKRGVQNQYPKQSSKVSNHVRDQLNYRKSCIFSYFGILILIGALTFSFRIQAQETKIKEWPDKKIQELTKLAYGGNIASFDSLASYYFDRAAVLKQNSWYDEEIKKGVAIVNGMQARFRRSRSLPNKVKIDYWQGLYYWQTGNYKLAFGALEIATFSSHSGQCLSHYLVGQIYYNGLSRAKDIDRSRYHFEKASELSCTKFSAESEYQLGELYSIHRQDIKEAQKWYQKSFDNGYEKAKAKLDSLNAELAEESKIISDNPTLKDEAFYYGKVKMKTEKAHATIEKVFLELESKRNHYTELKKGRELAEANIEKTHADLNKRKSEFETSEQYKERKNEFKKFQADAIKPYNDSIAELFKPYEPFKTQRLTEINVFYSELAKVEILKGQWDGYLEMVNKFPPAIESYKTARVWHMEYDAENEVFKVTTESSLKRGDLRDYFFNVPLAEAQVFKENQEENKFYCFFDDLRVVISGGKSYQAQDNYDWKSKVHCDSFNPQLVSDDIVEQKFFDFNGGVEPALINGEENGAEVFGELINNDPKIHQVFVDALGNKNFYGRKSWEADIYVIYSNEEALKKGLNEIRREYKVKFTSPSGLSDEIDELMRNVGQELPRLLNGFDVTLKRVNCEPVKTIYTFKLAKSFK